MRSSVVESAVTWLPGWICLTKKHDILAAPPPPVCAPEEMKSDGTAGAKVAPHPLRILKPSRFRQGSRRDPFKKRYPSDLGMHCVFRMHSGVSGPVDLEFHLKAWTVDTRIINMTISILPYCYHI